MVAALGATVRVALAEPAPVATCADNEVRITRVGYGDGWPALEEELTETLRAQGLCVRFESQPQLTIDAVRKLDPTVPAVWIELLSAERARLVLTDARRGRYLLRDVSLGNGLDGVGREALSQVIEASLLALRGQARVLDGAELERLMAGPVAPPATASSAVPSPSPILGRKELSEAPARGPTGTARTYHVRLAPSYSLQWTGSDLGALHGFGLSLGVLRRWGKDRWWGAAVGYTAHAPQRFLGSLVAARTERHDGWLTARFELPVSTNLDFVTEAGAGLAWSRVAPQPVPGGLEDVAAAADNRALWLRLELGLQHRFHAFTVQATAVNDVAMHDTHYDVTLEGARRRLVNPWVINPGGRLALGWHY